MVLVPTYKPHKTTWLRILSGRGSGEPGREAVRHAEPLRVVRVPNLRCAIGFDFVFVRQELETWLLADERAINALALERNGRAIPGMQGQIEEINQPKERLRPRTFPRRPAG